jgi:hypothetical protein
MDAGSLAAAHWRSRRGLVLGWEIGLQATAAPDIEGAAMKASAERAIRA